MDNSGDPDVDDLSTVMAGRVLTHRVTAEDVEAGSVDLLDPDLSALALAIDPDLDEVALPPNAVEGCLVALRSMAGQPTLDVVDEVDTDVASPARSVSATMVGGISRPRRGREYALPYGGTA